MKRRKIQELIDFLGGLDPRQREQFAKSCGTTPGYLSLVAGGHRKASAALAIEIDRESGSKAPVEVLAPDVDWNYIMNRCGRRRRKKAVMNDASMSGRF